MTNPAGSAIVNAIGPIRQVVRGEDKIQRRYLVIAPGTVANFDRLRFSNEVDGDRTQLHGSRSANV